MTELQKFELAKSRGFTYNPTTGELKGVYGKVIKTKLLRGYFYCSLRVGDKVYNLYAHRLAWYLHHGKLPVNYIDHIDNNTSNNKIENLRDVTNQQNQWNQSKSKGFSWCKNANKFRAQIAINRKNIHLGLFNTAEEARSAYIEAKKKYHKII